MNNLLILLVCFAMCCAMFNSCTSNNGPHENATVKRDTHGNFEKWLGTHELSIATFKDTIVTKAFELWAIHNDVFQEKDSIFHLYPSTDSSYYLLTYLSSKEEAIYGNGKDFIFMFSDAKFNHVFGGFGFILTKGDSLMLDHYWYDNKTVFILEKNKSINSSQLFRLTIGVDSLWEYEI